MKRYMISPIIGDGTQNNPYRAAVADLSGVETNSLIPTHVSGPDIGKPLYNFAFCRVSANNLTSVLEVSNAYVFPDFPLDSRMDGMELEARTGMIQSVESYDLDGAGLHFVADHTSEESYRQVVSRIAQQIEPAFHADRFDVSEPQA